jgi:hypothetical protein
MKCLMPAELRMRCSDNPLSEYEVDEEQDEDPGANEDHRCYGDFDIVWVTSPDNSHDTGDVSSHAEAEQEAGHEELVAFALVRLEYEHMPNCSKDEEKEEDGRYWDVYRDARHPSNGGSLGWVWRMEWHLAFEFQYGIAHINEGKHTLCEDAIAVTTFGSVQGTSWKKQRAILQFGYSGRSL